MKGNESGGRSLSFEPVGVVRVPKTAEVVAHQIRQRIVRGELDEGDFLPSEVQMMSMFSVSRPTLREAFRILEVERLITVVRGARTGARVHRPAVESAARYAGSVLQSQRTTIHDVYQARLAIEPFVVRSLAERKDQHAADSLTQEVDRLEKLIDEAQYPEFMIGLAQFHYLLVKLSGNQTLAFMTQLLQNIVAQHQVEFFKHGKMPADGQRSTSLWGLRSFRKLIDLIRQGLVTEAEAHWRLHLKNANARWLSATEPDKVIDVV